MEECTGFLAQGLARMPAAHQGRTMGTVDFEFTLNRKLNGSRSTELSGVQAPDRDRVLSCRPPCNSEQQSNEILALASWFR
eukprot:scaffold14274_cov215-Skeletonema_marinoi.AAC.25